MLKSVFPNLYSFLSETALQICLAIGGNCLKLAIRRAFPPTHHRLSWRYFYDASTPPVTTTTTIISCKHVSCCCGCCYATIARILLRDCIGPQWQNIGLVTGCRKLKSSNRTTTNAQCSKVSIKSIFKMLTIILLVTFNNAYKSVVSREISRMNRFEITFCAIASK